MRTLKIGRWDVSAEDVITSVDGLLQHLEDWTLYEWEREIPHAWEPGVHPVTIREMLEAAAEADPVSVCEEEGWVIYVDGNHPVAIREDVLERAKEMVIWVVWLPVSPYKGVWHSTYRTAGEAKEEAERLRNWSK